MSFMESQVFVALALALVGGLSNSIGALFVVINQAPNLKMLGLLQGFSAGLMLSISFFYLVHNAIDSIGFLKGNLWFFAGATFFAYVASFIPELSPISDDKKNDGDEGSEDINKEHRRQVLFSGIITALGISLHNFLEGMAVHLGSIKGFPVGLNLALAIALHHIPEGIAVALPVYFATQSKWRAFTMAVLSGFADPLGVIIVAYLFPDSLSSEIVEDLLGSDIKFMNAILSQALKKKQEGEKSKADIPPLSDDSIVRALSQANAAHAATPEENMEIHPHAESYSCFHKRKTTSDIEVLPEGTRLVAPIEERPVEGEEEGKESLLRPHLPKDYTSEVALLGQGSNHLIPDILHYMTSEIDAEHIADLTSMEIMQRTCNSIFDSCVYAGAMFRRQSGIMLRAYKDKKEGQLALTKLTNQLDQAQEAHAQELSNLKDEANDALRKKESEIQVERRAAQRWEQKFKACQEELALAHKKADEDHAQLVKERVSFEEEYLKSTNFQVACSTKALEYLGVGFKGAVDLFKANGYPPEGDSTSFLDFDNFVNNLPPNV